MKQIVVAGLATMLMGANLFADKVSTYEYAAYKNAMVEGDTAKILHPKYYLAIAYPNLSMGEFMSISGTPGDIEEYFTSLFK